MTGNEEEILSPSEDAEKAVANPHRDADSQLSDRKCKPNMEKKESAEPKKHTYINVLGEPIETDKEHDGAIKVINYDDIARENTQALIRKDLLLD